MVKMESMKLRKWLVLIPILLALAGCTRDPKVRAQRYINNGNKFFDKGDFKGASIMYRGALKEDRRSGEAWYRLSLTDLKLYAYGDAFKALLNTIELQPNNADAKAKLAQLYLLSAIQNQNAERKADDLNNAKDLADKLLQQDANSFEAHSVLGQIALIKEDLPGAIAAFEAANSEKPLQTGVVVSYVQALTASNRFPEAEKLAMQMIDKDKGYSTIYDVLYVEYVRLNRMDDAERLLKLKVANNPKNTAFLMQLATFYEAAKRQADAEAVIRDMTNEKEHPDGHLLAGDFFFYRLHDLDRARAEYQAAMKAFPKDKAIYEKRLIEMDAKTGDVSSANGLLAGVLKDNPKDSDALGMQAALKLSSGDRNQINAAVSDFQSLVTKNPENFQLRYNLATALHQKGDDEQAIVQLQEALKRRPDYLRARVLLATLYQARGESPKALEAANEIIAQSNNNIQGHLVRARALLDTHNQDQARKELDYIVKTFPQNVEARYEVGHLDFVEKDYKSSAEVFGKLYKENPKDHRGLAGVVETLAAEGHMPEAVAEMNKAIAAEPDKQDLKLFMANLEVRNKNYDHAIQLYQGLLAQDQKNADLLNRLGETYRLKGDMNMAIDKFRAASQAAPSDPMPLLRLAMTLQTVDRNDEAEPIYAQVLKLQPDQAVALNNLAFLKADKGKDLEEALTMAQRAKQKAPNSKDVADTLGYIYVKKNLSEEAVHVFQDLVAKDPGNPTYRYHYGMALMEKGDKPSTKRELEQALKDHPSKPQEAEIRDLLAKL